MEKAPALAPRLMVYPNPTADGRLQVQLTEAMQGKVRYSLLSSVGSKLAEGTLTNAGTVLELDFSRLLRGPGLFYLRMEGANVRQTFRIMRK